MLPKFHYLGIIEKYQEDVTHVLEKYMEMYRGEYPGGKSPLTASDFLHKHNDNYRAEINSIAILSFRSNGYDKAVHDKIIQLNDQDTLLLRARISELSTGVE